MSNPTLIHASHAMDNLLDKLREAEGKRDEAQQFLRAIIAAHEADDTEAMENAIHYADFWLKGGL